MSNCTDKKYYYALLIRTIVRKKFSKIRQKLINISLMRNLKLKKKIIKIKKVIILTKNTMSLYIMHAQSLRKKFF